MIEPDDRSEGNIGIDLDESGWHSEHADHMRVPGVWHLFEKIHGTPVAMLVVYSGEQPYYVQHHVGNLSVATELSAYGIGKKCLDGSMVRIWLLPNGTVRGGGDVDDLWRA